MSKGGGCYTVMAGEAGAFSNIEREKIAAESDDSKIRNTAVHSEANG